MTAAAAAVTVAIRADPSDTFGSVDTGSLPTGPEAPALTPEGWINTEPLTADDLSGRVVVYDFWTYSCVNCVRTIPHLRAWYERYQRDGLIIVGIHSPEFEFEKDHGNVTRATQRLGVSWPVALDGDMRIWRAFENQYWPAKYVADREGHVRYTHFGEGSYDETEDVLRTLLGVKVNAPRAAEPRDAEPEPGTTTERITPETYLGTERGSTSRHGLFDYPEPDSVPPGLAALAGQWDADGERIKAAKESAAILLSYRAREVNLVMASPDGIPVDVTVEVDGRPLPEDWRTTQTMLDGDGKTYVRVTHSDLYRLVLAPSSGRHTLRLTARTPGLEAFAFTFGA